MAEVASWVRLRQKVIILPGAVSGTLINLVLALFPGLVYFHAILQPLPIGGSVCHSSAPASPQHFLGARGTASSLLQAIRAAEQHVELQP